MSDDSGVGGQQQTGLQLGFWLGAAVSALGIAASVTIVTLGGMATMDEGGFVASGGPYVIAHPAPEGFWILPIAFIGMVSFPIAHAFFANRIKGFGLIYATWCAVWTAIGATTLWYGFNPPGGGGLAGGWLTMGGIFLVVGIGSIAVYVWTKPLAEMRDVVMATRSRMIYSAMTLAALAAGVFVGTSVFRAIVG